MELQRNRNSVFQIGYHFVWCVKYRKPVLTNQAVEDLKELFLRIADDNN
ncbi:MAG: transposase, partial [Desulfotomaculales bacterium]